MASKDYWIDLEELSQLGRELAEENLDPDLQGVDIRAFERLQPDEQVSVDNKDRPTEDEIDIKKIGSKLAEIKRRAEESGILSSREPKEKDDLDSG